MQLSFLCGIVYKLSTERSQANGSLAQLGEHLPYKQRVTGSNPVTSTNKTVRIICGNSSVVERHLAKVNVAGSNLVSRSNIRTVFILSNALGRRDGAIAKR